MPVLDINSVAAFSFQMPRIKEMSPAPASAGELRSAVQEAISSGTKVVSLLEETISKLEENPLYHKEFCGSCDVDTAISKFEEWEEEAKSSRLGLAEDKRSIGDSDPDLRGMLSMVDKIAYDMICLYQEVRWRFMLLDGAAQPTSGKSYGSAKEAIQALWE